MQQVEYKGTKSPMTPFQLKDTSLRCGTTNFDTLQTPSAALKTNNYRNSEFKT